MLNYKELKDEKTGEAIIETRLTGKTLINAPLLNKGSAFSADERRTLGLIGKLPDRIESLNEQVDRAYAQYLRYSSNLQRNIFLHGLHESNTVLFYKLVSEHLSEMVPVIYTPVVGEVVKTFSQEFRQPRGLYISFDNHRYIREILANRTHRQVDVIAITDGEGVLGIGDQGIGGMAIVVAKLMMYSICGMNPYRTLPIMLDVGTNNPDVLAYPHYLGVRHPRVKGEEYYKFIGEIVTSIKEYFPKAFIHWEDFGRESARVILDRHKDEFCMFNDDMQGTGVVTLAALLSAVHVTNQPLSQHRVVIYGAGTAGVGIAEQLFQAMVRSGLSESEARQRFYLIDRQGLLLSTMTDLMDFQRPFARDPKEFKQSDDLSLEAVVHAVKPTIMVGCSTVRGAFTESIVREMASHCARPIIFPLSNPTDNCEARPENLIKWTQGTALIATGSPFEPVSYEGKEIPIAQCNNALAFPGIGLGLVASGAKKLSDGMLWAAARVLCELSPARDNETAALLPPIMMVRHVAHVVALGVIEAAIEEGIATKQGTPLELLEAILWQPDYRRIRYKEK